MARRLIGTGKTGTDGSVTIPYTGIGAGIMDLQVETEIGGETVSQNFSITDCLIYDSGINDGQKNTNVTIGTNVTEQVSNEGTTLECTNGTSLVAAQYTYNSIISGDFETIITVTSASRILMGFYGGNDSSRILLNNVTNRKYKFKREGSVLTAQYYNGSDWVDLSWYNDSLGSKNCKFYMYLYADDTTNTVTFKDMEVLNKNENVLIIDGSSNVIQSGDVVTMEGRLYKNGVLAKNTVLDVYKNGAMVGTVNTGSTGVASYNYTGLGVGETEFYFKYGSFVSETFTLTDCMIYDTTEYSFVGNGTARSQATNNNTFNNTNDWSFEADIKITGASARIEIVPPTYERTNHIGFGKSGTGVATCYVGKSGGGESNTNYPDITFNNDDYYHLKITKEGTTIKWYFEDSLVRTDTEWAVGWIGNLSTERIMLVTWGTSTVYVENMKVLPL